MYSFALLLRVFRSLLGLLEPFGGLLGWSWKLFGWFGGVSKTFLKPLLVLLERIWSSLGASLRALGAFFSFIFFHFKALGGGLGHRGILGDPCFQKWAPRLDGSMILETCTSKNGKRVTEGAYAFFWDERAGEGVREDETSSQITK